MHKWVEKMGVSLFFDRELAQKGLGYRIDGGYLVDMSEFGI